MGRTQAGTFSISLTVPFWRSTNEYNIEVQFKSAATRQHHLCPHVPLRAGNRSSISGHEDFMPIFDFNTTCGHRGAGHGGQPGKPAGACGRLASPSRTMNVNNSQKGASHMENNPDLHEERRLPDSRPEPDRAAAEAPGQVRQDAQSVPEGASGPSCTTSC